MKPSEIIITEVLPLSDTFGWAESEQMAALLVCVLARRDDQWGDVLPREVGDFMQHCIDTEIPHWMNNPTFNPTPDRLVRDGFVEWVGSEDDGRGRALRFTELGLSRLERWHRKPSHESEPR